MITRIEIDGFKTFQGFKLELAPFQIIIGSNGAGKSNLFDALRLLSRLAEHDLDTAFEDRQARGNVRELFTLGPDGQPGNRIRLAVELLIDSRITDPFWGTRDLSYPRLRYEIEVSRELNEQGLEQLYVTHEAFNFIPRPNDNWLQRYRGKGTWLPINDLEDVKEFFSIEEVEDQTTFTLYADRLSENSPQRKQSLLSILAHMGYPHIYAVYQELSSLRFLLHLDPNALRQPNSTLVRHSLLPDGEGLAGLLGTMQAEDPTLLHDVSRDISNLVPGIRGIDIEKDDARGEFALSARTDDGRTFSARVLSDGTLRLLALVALKYNPYHHGILCIEEPENGVHPFRLKDMARLLRALATDFTDPTQREEPLRQVLINTHSPLLVNQLSKDGGRPSDVVFAYTVRRLPGENQPPMRITRMVPVPATRQLLRELDIDDPEGAYTLRQVQDYLASARVGKARATVTNGGG